jgi:AraC-like DNA-binding protein
VPQPQPDEASRASALEVTGFLMRAVVEMVERQGLLPTDAEATGLVERTLRDVGDLVPAAVARQRLQALQAACGGLPIGLLAGERLTEPNLHVFGSLLTASRTVRDAYDNVGFLQQHVQGTRGGRLTLEPRYAHYELCVEAAGPVWEDLVMALAFHMLRRFLESALLPGGHDTELEAEFARPTPSDPSAYLRCFGGRVRFGAARSALRFPMRILDLARPGVDASLAVELRALALKRLTPARSVDGWKERVEAVLRDEHDLGAVALDRVAARLGVSARTLRRRLAAEGTSGLDVLDGVRFERAKRLLGDTAAPMADVAGALGYADEAGFRRAFKRWAGTTPQAFRAQAAERRG